MSQAYQNMCAGMYKVSVHTHTLVLNMLRVLCPGSVAVPFSIKTTHTHTLNSCLLVQTMIALDMDGKVRKPQFELDSEQVRYEHRFAPFNSVVTPPPVHYVQFKVL